MESFLIVINSLTLLASSTLIFSLQGRYIENIYYRKIIMGCVLGVCACLSMLQPIEFDTGVRIDGRNLFLGFSAAFFGIIGGLLSFLIAGFARFLLGGAGMFPGIFSMLGAVIAGLIWKTISEKYTLRFRWVLLGVFISATIPIILLVPQPFGMNAFLHGGPYLFLIYILGSLLFGTMLQNEYMFDLRNIILQQHAETDPLTSALNRRGLDKTFEERTKTFEERTKKRELGKRENGLAVFMIDIDDFKSINDTYGHDA